MWEVWLMIMRYLERIRSSRWCKNLRVSVWKLQDLNHIKIHELHLNLKNFDHPPRFSAYFLPPSMQKSSKKSDRDHQLPKKLLWTTTNTELKVKLNFKSWKNDFSFPYLYCTTSIRWSFLQFTLIKWNEDKFNLKLFIYICRETVVQHLPK